MRSVIITLPFLLIHTCSGVFWNGLRTTFPTTETLKALNLGYSSVPRLTSDALSEGWEVASSSSSCSGENFQGYRYVKRINSSALDCSVSALFDVNGVIAGLQMNIPVTQAKADPTNTYEFDSIPMFVRNTICGIDSYTLTSYYVDPVTICSSGRAPSALTTQGTGSALYFQNGTDSSAPNLIKAPMKRSDALSQGWSNNQCFPGMGVHCWYQQEQFKDTACNRILPVFLLYNTAGELLGFGFQHVGKSYSIRYEHPDAVAVGLIVGPSVSPCLLEKAGGPIGVTTMHVFLINVPQTQLCIPSIL